MPFKFSPLADGEAPASPKTVLRQRALELVMLELKYQPWLRFRMFSAGFAAGSALMLGLHVGLHLIGV